MAAPRCRNPRNRLNFDSTQIRRIEIPTRYKIVRVMREQTTPTPRQMTKAERIIMGSVGIYARKTRTHPRVNAPVSIFLPVLLCRLLLDAVSAFIQTLTCRLKPMQCKIVLSHEKTSTSEICVLVTANERTTAPLLCDLVGRGALDIGSNGPSRRNLIV